jgi:hypothetical protein
MLPQGPPQPNYSHVIQVPSPDQQAEYAAQRQAEQRADIERQRAALANGARFAQNYHYPRPQYPGS